MEENEEIKEAIDELTGMSKDEELQRLAFLREKAIRDEKSIRRTGLEEGIAMGKDKGRKERNTEIARNMLKENIKMEIIIKVTGLTEYEIKELQKN